MPESETLAPRPPTGWNSWDCYGASVTEEQVKATAEFMAEHLAPYGWQYVVVDIDWHHPDPPQSQYPDTDDFVLDDWGRPLPAPNRFPSAAGGAGFGPLADHVHALGLKFGVHVVRGIPRTAVRRDLPLLGASHTASEIADRERVCAWFHGNWGIDSTKPGAQEYYDSLIRLFAGWGVDYVKADDMNVGRDRGEIECISRAVTGSGRPMVLSLSGGELLAEAGFVREHAQLWRISNDVWDNWDTHDPGQEWTATLKDQFARCAHWAPHAGPGHWPDPDMLPLGRICLANQHGPERDCRLTPDEQRTMMTLWCISCAPLMFGGDVLSLDDFTHSLLTAEEVLSANQEGSRPRQVSRTDSAVVWTSEAKGSRDRYVALFNIGDEGPADVAVSLADLGIEGPCAVRDLWTRADLGPAEGQVAASVPEHGASLFRIVSGA